MKRKGLIIGIVAVVIIIIIIVIIKSASSSASKKQDEADALQQAQDNSDSGLGNPQKDCRKLCRTLCKKKSALFGGRQKCIRNCKSDCAAHDSTWVKSHYP